MGEQFKRWKAALMAHLFGAMPDPRVAEAVRQQQAVAGDTHSRKVDPRAVVAAARRRELAATCQHEFDTDTDAIAWLIGEGK